MGTLSLRQNNTTVIPACPGSFFKHTPALLIEGNQKDSRRRRGTEETRQAGTTKRSIFIIAFAVFSLLLFCSAALSEAFKLPDTGQTKCYQGVHPYAEIPCAGTGQDGAYTINPMSFTVIGNNSDMVRDNNTGLVWQRYENATTYNWYRASGTYHADYNPSSQSVCGSLTLGGHSDWRLPSKKELITIVDYSIPWPGPTINRTYFPNAYASLYWSSTTCAGYPDAAWYVFFGSGFVYNRHKDDYGYVRCVRGGQ